MHVLSTLTLMTMMLALAAPVTGDVRRTPSDHDIRAAAAMMRELRPESVAHAARMRDAYRHERARLAIADRAALGRALAEGQFLPVSGPWLAGNVALRLTGTHPIGELDRTHQDMYVAVRPETLGCLLHVASRVDGPLEVTSLVRHAAYQRALARGNANAQTQVPTHVMGLAFDISILHAPRETAEQLRDVLRLMAADGDLFFIAEQRQLVFHVVPTPERRAYYAAIAEVLTSEPAPRPGLPHLRRAVLHTPAAVLPVMPRGTLSLPALETSGYAGLFGLLLMSGLGLPPGEDVALAGLGALVAHGVVAWWPVLLLALVSVTASDTAWFWIGRKSAAVPRLPRLLPQRLVTALDALVRRWGVVAVALARFIPGTRGVIFVTAGARGLRPRTFMLVDLLAAAAWVTVVVGAAAWLLSATGAPDLPLLSSLGLRA